MKSNNALEDETVSELKTKAREAGISGISHMHKDELVDALEHAAHAPKNEQTDAIEILKADHAKVKALFKKALAKKHGDKTVEPIVQEIIHELKLHTEAEETIFYPALKTKSTKEHNEDATDGVLEAYVEHDSVKELITKIEATDSSDESYKAMVQVMSEQIEHHVEEEETEMFKQAKHLLKNEELQKLGKQILEKKQGA